MDKNKKHHVLHKGLLVLLFSVFGANACYAEDQTKILSVLNTEALSNVEIVPDSLPMGDGAKKFTIKNKYAQEIEVTSIKSVNGKKYVIPTFSDSVKVPAGETHEIELQPGICPDGFLGRGTEQFAFTYKVMVDGSLVDKSFNAEVTVSCYKDYERALADRDAAIERAHKAEKDKADAVAAAIAENTQTMKTGCKTACEGKMTELSAELRSKTGIDKAEDRVRKSERDKFDAELVRINAEHKSASDAVKAALDAANKAKQDADNAHKNEITKLNADHKKELDAKDKVKEDADAAYKIEKDMLKTDYEKQLAAKDKAKQEVETAHIQEIERLKASHKAELETAKTDSHKEGYRAGVAAVTGGLADTALKRIKE